MRTLQISVFSCGLLTSLSAFAADSSTDPSEQPAPLMKLGSADPAGVGPLTVAPAEVHLPVSGPSQTDDFVFDYHGYFRVPLMRVGRQAHRDRPRSEQHDAPHSGGGPRRDSQRRAPAVGSTATTWPPAGRTRGSRTATRR